MIDDIQTILSMGITRAEHEALSQVVDTIVVKRKELAFYAMGGTRLTSGLTFDECLAAVDSCIAKGLLVELTPSMIEQDLMRWRNEPIPVSWQVERRRQCEDIDITESGHRLWKRIVTAKFPSAQPSPAIGYDDRFPGKIEALGQTESACQSQLATILRRINADEMYIPILDDPYCNMRHASLRVTRIGELESIGSWWQDRYELIDAGCRAIVHYEEMQA